MKQENSSITGIVFKVYRPFRLQLATRSFLSLLFLYLVKLTVSFGQLFVDAQFFSLRGQAVPLVLRRFLSTSLEPTHLASPRFC